MKLLLDSPAPAHTFPSMTPVTPIRQPPIEDLRNALQICIAYADPNVADSDAMRQLERVKQLIQAANDKLGEPHERTVEAALRFLSGGVNRDEARDLCAVV